MKKAKRFRIAFTTDQLNSLEREFRKYPYVGGVRRREIADELLISERAIKIWFQNRRMKEKRENSNKETDGEEQNQLQADFSKDHIHNVGGITYNELQSLPTLPVSNENVTDIKINKELAEDLRTKSKLTVSEGNAIITPSNPDVTVSKATCDPSHERKQIADNSHGSNFVLSPGYLKSECSGLQCLPNSLAADEQHLSTCKLNKAQHPQQTYTKPLDRSRKYSERTGVDSEHSHHLKDNSNCITSETLNWNPITVAPIMSSRIPSATTSNSGIGTYSMTPPQIMPNRTCCCDCHLNYPSSHVVVQTNTFTQPVQYEINPVLFHRFPPNKK